MNGVVTEAPLLPLPLPPAELAGGGGDHAGFGEVVAPSFAHFEGDGVRQKFDCGGTVRVGNR